MSKEFEIRDLPERYQVLRPLGKGGMGAVYLAHDRVLDRDVALKVVLPKHAADSDILGRIQNEMKLQARIESHPNIVAIYDRLDVNGAIIIVMEHVPGEALDRIIDRAIDLKAGRGSARETVVASTSQIFLNFEPDEVIQIALQCLDALEIVHAKGVVHRDVKPPNWMVMRDSYGELRVKLADFGIAKLYGGAAAQSDTPTSAMTQVGLIIGSPSYMAPEQIEPGRFGPVGPPADLYALGVTLFEMLTLRRPFTGTPTELFNAHANMAPPIHLIDCPKIGPRLRAILSRAMAKEQSERYGSAADFRDDLAALRNKTAAAPPKQAERRPAAKIIVVAGLITVALMGAAAAYLLKPDDAEKKKDAVAADPAPPAAASAAPAAPDAAAAAASLQAASMAPASVEAAAAPAPQIAAPATSDVEANRIASELQAKLDRDAEKAERNQKAEQERTAKQAEETRKRNEARSDAAAEPQISDQGASRRRDREPVYRPAPAQTPKKYDPQPLDPRLTDTFRSRDQSEYVNPNAPRRLEIRTFKGRD